MKNKPNAQKLKISNNLLFVIAVVLILVNSYYFMVASREGVTGKAGSEIGLTSICIGIQPTVGNPSPGGPQIINGTYNSTLTATNTDWVSFRYFYFGITPQGFGTDYDANNDSVFNATLNTTALPDGNCNYRIRTVAGGLCNATIVGSSAVFTINNIDVEPTWDEFKNNLSTNFSNYTSWVGISNAAIGIPGAGTINFSHGNFDDADLDHMFNISHNLITMNVSWQIHNCFDDVVYKVTFFNITQFAEPVVVKSGGLCGTRCYNLQYNNGSYVFSTRVSTENAQFSIAEGGNISVNFTFNNKTYDNSPRLNISTYINGSVQAIPIDANCSYMTDIYPTVFTRMEITGGINHSQQLVEHNWSYINTTMGHHPYIQHPNYYDGSHLLIVNCTLLYPELVYNQPWTVMNSTFRIMYTERDRVYYRDGNEIKLYLQLEEPNLTINTDLSQIDSNFNAANVTVINTGLDYNMSYNISSTNTRQDGKYNITIEAFNASGGETMNGSIFAHLRNNWNRSDIDNAFDCWNFKQGYYFDEVACDWESDLNHAADLVDVFTVEISCFDGIDNDLDSDIDENDTDCAGTYYHIRNFVGIDSAFFADPCANNVCRVCIGDADINNDGICDSSSGVNVRYLHKVRPGYEMRARFNKNFIAAQSTRVSINFLDASFDISPSTSYIRQLPNMELGGCVGGTDCKSVTATTFGPGLPDRWIGALDEKISTKIASTATTGPYPSITVGKSISGVSAFQNLVFFEIDGAAIINESDNAAYCFDGDDNDLNDYYDCLDISCNLTSNPADPSERCEYGTELTCDDGYDNDWDGYTDCEDNDCFQKNGTTGPCYAAENFSITSCADSVNNDFDWGYLCDATTSISYQTRQTNGAYSSAVQITDCFDIDCDGRVGDMPTGARCEYCNERTCNDNFDNDWDNYYDCTGNAYRTIYERDCDRWHDVTITCPTIETNCSNDLDDDLDSDSPDGEFPWLGIPVYGGWDCRDLDCNDVVGDTASGAVCQYRNETACEDGFDNDADGTTDCDDPVSCKGLSGQEVGLTGLCRPCAAVENISIDSCRDGDDNDYDGLIDCADPDCYGQPGIGRVTCGITELNCTDGIDNDLDGLTDYEDVDECIPEPTANELGPGQCDDNIDNDADNTTDCGDSECVDTIICREGEYAKFSSPVPYTGYIDLASTKYIAAGEDFKINYSTVSLGAPLSVDSVVLKLGNAQYPLRGIAPVLDNGTFAVEGNYSGFTIINDTYGIKVQKMDGFNGTLNLRFVTITGSSVPVGEYDLFVSSSMPGDYSSTVTTVYVAEGEVPLVRDVDVNVGNRKVGPGKVNVTLDINVTDTGTFDAGIHQCEIKIIYDGNGSIVYNKNVSGCVDAIPLSAGTYNVSVTTYDGSYNPSASFSKVFSFVMATVPAQDGNFYNPYPAENYPDKEHFNHTEMLNIGVNFDGGSGYDGANVTDCIVNIKNLTHSLFNTSINKTYVNDYAYCNGQVNLETLFNMTRGLNSSRFPDGIYYFTVSVWDNESNEGRSSTQNFNFCQYDYDNQSSKYRCWDECQLRSLANNAPVLVTSIPNQTWPRATRLSVIDLDDYFVDPDNDPLTYSWNIDTTRIAVSIDRANIITFDPDQSFYGFAHITFYADDGFTSTPSNLVTLEVVYRQLPQPLPIPAGGGGGGGMVDVNITEIEICDEDWTCTDWGPCLPSGYQFRTCRDKNDCGTSNEMPNTTRICIYIPTCRDRLRNQGEIGVDCGGPCPPCASCTDSVLNQKETNIAQIMSADPRDKSDCGGPFCPRCPTCDDNRQNGGETGIDCGGPCDSCATCQDGIRNQGEVNIDCGGPCPSCKVHIEARAFNWNLLLLIASSLFMLCLLTIALLFGVFKKKFIRMKAKLLNYHMRLVRMFEKKKMVEKELPILRWINTHIASIEEAIPSKSVEQSVNSIDRLVRIFFKRIFLIRYAFTNDELVKDLEKHKMPVVLRKATELLFEELSQIKYGGESVDKDSLKTLTGQVRVITERVVTEIETKKKTKISISERDIDKISETLSGAKQLGVGEAMKKSKK